MNEHRAKVNIKDDLKNINQAVIQQANLYLLPNVEPDVYRSDASCYISYFCSSYGENWIAVRLGCYNCALINFLAAFYVKISRVVGIFSVLGHFTCTTCWKKKF